MQVQCDHGLARWQPEPCNSNNFLPICRIGLINMCRAESTCVDEDKFCGKITKQTEKLEFKISEAEELIKLSLGSGVFEKPSFSVDWDRGAYIVQNGVFGFPDNLTFSNFNSSDFVSSDFEIELPVTAFDSTKHKVCECSCSAAPSSFVDEVDSEKSDIYFFENGTVSNLVFIDSENPGNEYTHLEINGSKKFECDSEQSDFREIYRNNSGVNQYFNSLTDEVTMFCKETFFKNTAGKIEANQAGYFYEKTDLTKSLIPFKTTANSTSTQQHLDFCERITCQAPSPNPIGSELVFINTGFSNSGTIHSEHHVGTSIKYICNSDCLTGTIDRNCEINPENSKSSSWVDTGVCETITCQNLPVSIDNSVLVGENKTCGAKIVQTCANGFDLFLDGIKESVNFVESVCGENNTDVFSPDISGYRCVRKCGSPMGLNIKDVLVGQFYEGDSVTVSCDDGFTVNAVTGMINQSVTCSAGRFPETIER